MICYVFRSYHNYLRITRILKCLGELGYQHYQYPLVDFFLTEALETGKLSNAADPCLNYWIHTVRNEREKEKLLDRACDLGAERAPPESPSLGQRVKNFFSWK